MKNERNKTIIVMLQTVYWVLLGLTFIVFYYSLRNDQDGFRATIYALIMWGATYLIHLLIKKLKKQSE
ncbi:MAG: hypothetical protein ACNS62_03445 [Candidatus Cyclobacteriaceae bacterium M3_2C_046]